MNKLEAVQTWVDGFNGVSSSLIERAFRDDIDNWVELTPIVPGKNVYYNGEYVYVDKVILEKDSNGSITSDSKVILDKEEEISICLSDENICAIDVNGQKLYIEEYDFENGVFMLENCLQVRFEEVREVYYVNSDFDVELRAKVLNVETEELDYEDYEYELRVFGTVVDYYDISNEFDSWLPMWGTLWTFGEGLDECWARENAELVAQCGFRIFEDQETGDVYIGIDGAGYSFYDAHWIPLYEARGLMWHDDEKQAI